MKLSQAKLLVKAIPGLEAGAKKYSKENAVTCVIKPDGRVWENYNHACYAGLGYNEAPNNALAIGSRIFLGGDAWRKSTYKLTDKEKLAYLDYIINRSPWANAFFSKDVRSVMKRKVLFTDPNQPSNYLVGAMIATRYCHEYTHWICMWNKLVAAGVSEDFAWLSMHCTNYDPQKGDSLSFLAVGNGHACLTYVKTSTVKHYMKHTQVNPNQLWNENHSYYGIDGLWCKPERNIQTNLSDKFEELARNKSKKGEGNNPFAKANGYQEATKISLDDAIQIIAENEKPLLKELLK